MKTRKRKKKMTRMAETMTKRKRKKEEQTERMSEKCAPSHDRITLLQMKRKTAKMRQKMMMMMKRVMETTKKTKKRQMKKNHTHPQRELNPRMSEDIAVVGVFVTTACDT